eukprot:86997_1
MTWDHLNGIELQINILFIGSLTILCMVTLFILIRQTCAQNTIKNNQLIINPNKISLLKTMKQLLVCCALISTLSNASDFARFVICFMLNENLYAVPLNNIFAFADFLYLSSSILFYLVAIGRLQISFIGTNYAIHYCFLLCFYILVGIQFILSTYYVLTVAFATGNNHYQFWVHYDSYPLIAICAIDFILNTSLLILFVAKLRQLLFTMIHNSNKFQLKKKDSFVYKTSFKLLILITRHSILFSLAILTNSMW